MLERNTTMIHIAICDDKRVTTANLEELLQTYTKEKLLEVNILYFSTPCSSYFCDESLLQWEEKISPNIFFRCHKKYLVNLNSVESIKDHTILLANGEKLPVSRRKWTLLKYAFIKFDITMKGRT